LISFDNPNQVNVVKESYLLEFILIVVFFGILIYLLRRNFIDPIIILSQQADLVGCGKDDIEIPESNILEINQLSKSIISIQHFIKTEQDLKSQLDVTNQKLHSLLKSISHDLRNYISGISWLAEIIAEKKELTKENIKQDQQYAQMITKQSKLMLGFVKDVLNTENENLGIIKLDDEQDCDIKELIEEMLILNQHFVRDQQVKIITKFQENLPTLRCDRRRFRRVIDNLITNAVKYSKRGGEVEVSCQLLVVSDRENKEKRQIQIIIKDNGIGMTQEDIKAVLAGNGKDVDKSDLDKPIDSHGIGMSIVVQIVEALGAKMEIESEKKKGTTVKLWFNMGDDNSDNKLVSVIENENENVGKLQALPAKKKQVKTKSLKKPKTILIADDEEINLMLLERVLSGTDHKIIKAKNGREVLEILDQQKCDLIFMDIKMPEIDGLEATKKIRSGKFKNKKHQFIPIIAVSGNDDAQSKKKALRAGIDNVIGKPFAKKEVLDLVKKLLG
jgi:signal transduction histidine kinase/ActR/RegA family two-component response regulator